MTGATNLFVNLLAIDTIRIELNFSLKRLIERTYKCTDCTDWELTKLIDIKRQEYANNRDKVSHCQRFHLRLALDHGSTETL